MNLDDPPVVEMRSEGRPALFQEKSYGSSDRSEIFETDSDSEESFTPSLRAPGPHLEAIGAATKATDLLSRQTEPLFITKVIQ